MAIVDFIKQIPDEVINCNCEDLWSYFPNTTLAHLDFGKEQNLFLSCILHGNENAGFYAIQRLLKKYQNDCPKNLFILFGNPQAARYKQRHLAHQPDYNRIWRGGNSPENKMAKKILEHLSQHTLFASIDIHNNTGKNPKFICINHKKPEFINLARLFSGHLVYFDDPREVLSIAMAKQAPSVTIECGLPDDETGVQKAFDFVEKVLLLDKISDEDMGSVKIFDIMAKIKIPDDVTFSTEKPAPVRIDHTVEKLNFTKIENEMVIANYDPEVVKVPFTITNGDGQDLSERFVRFENGKVIAIPGSLCSMMTLDEKVIRQDCLGYFMLEVHT